MEKWTDKELRLIKRYEKLSNDYEATPDVVKECKTMGEILFMEANLLVCNKDVIGYENNKPVGIFPFKEALHKERLLMKKCIFTFHPVNYPSMKEYAEYLDN